MESLLKLQSREDQYDEDEDQRMVFNLDSSAWLRLIAYAQVALTIGAGVIISVPLIDTAADFRFEYDFEELNMTFYKVLVPPKVHQEMLDQQALLATEKTDRKMHIAILSVLFTITQLHWPFAFVLLIGTNFENLACLKTWRIYAIINDALVIVELGNLIWLLTNPLIPIPVIIAIIRIGWCTLSFTLCTCSIWAVKERTREIELTRLRKSTSTQTNKIDSMGSGKSIKSTE